MTTSYFESTWAASCVASTGGAIYAAFVAALISRGRIGFMEIVWVILISVVVSLPLLIAGSATIGWWVTRTLARRVRTNRIMLFSMVGMTMGMIADLALFLGAYVFLPHSLDMPRGMNEWINSALVASIPLFFLTLAGFVAGMHVTHRVQAAAGNRP